jgi:hypothetical protein
MATPPRNLLDAAAHHGRSEGMLTEPLAAESLVLATINSLRGMPDQEPATLQPVRHHGRQARLSLFLEHRAGGLMLRVWGRWCAFCALCAVTEPMEDELFTLQKEVRRAHALLQAMTSQVATLQGQQKLTARAAAATSSSCAQPTPPTALNAAQQQRGQQRGQQRQSPPSPQRRSHSSRAAGRPQPPPAPPPPPPPPLQLQSPTLPRSIVQSEQGQWLSQSAPAFPVQLRHVTPEELGATGRR